MRHYQYFPPLKEYCDKVKSGEMTLEDVRKVMGIPDLDMEDLEHPYVYTESFENEEQKSCNCGCDMIGGTLLSICISFTALILSVIAILLK